MRMVPLKELARVEVSNVDKKAKEGEKEVFLCNFVDVYHNWAITSEMRESFMRASANDAQIEKLSLYRGQVAITKDSETRDDIGIPTYIADDLENTVLGYHCILITPDESMLRGKFLNIVLHSPYAQKYFEANASGSGQRYTLTNDIVENFPVPLATIEDQDNFGSLCSDIDAKIQNNNTTCSDLEAMAKLLYDYWFVQFDFPDENGKPYKSSGGKMVWNEDLKREIPEGWEVGNLYSIAEFVNGLACQKYRPVDERHRLPVIKIGEMHNGFGNDVEWARDDVPGKNIIDDGDILFSWSASLEVMLWNKGKGVLNQHIFKVVPKEYHKAFVYQVLKGYVKNFVKMAEARKTTMGHITTDHLMQSRILLPSPSIVKKYGCFVEDIYKEYIKSSRENLQLGSLREFLLPMLMNGQVYVGN